MQFTHILLSFSLAASAWAAPGSLCKKGSCNADDCLRAVRASSASPFPSSATADCSSFLQKTVTPCAATSTATATVTVTHTPGVVTVTDVAALTQANTVVETVISAVTSIFDTVTFIQPTEVDVIETIVQPTTVTGLILKKRTATGTDIPALPPTLSPLIQARSAGVSVAPSTCSAATNAPTSVPTYASACSGTVRYSSACSCAGVTAATVTISRSTVVTTATATVTVTPILTVTDIATNTIPVTVTETELIPTTFETTDATVIIPSAFTLTESVIVPTTVVVSPPVCSSYKFVVTDGPRAGQFIGANDPASADNIDYGYVVLTADASSAKSWNILPSDDVYSSQNVFGWVTQNAGVYQVLEMTDNSESYYQIQYVKCSVVFRPNTYPNAAGILACTQQDGTPTDLATCTRTGDDLMQGPNAASTESDCTALNFAAIVSC